MSLQDKINKSMGDWDRLELEAEIEDNRKQQELEYHIRELTQAVNSAYGEPTARLYGEAMHIGVRLGINLNQEGFMRAKEKEGELLKKYDITYIVRPNQWL